MPASFNTAAFDATVTARKFFVKPRSFLPSRYEKSRGNCSRFESSGCDDVNATMC